MVAIPSNEEPPLRGGTRRSRMVDFNSGLWNLLGQTPVDEFEVEDNGLTQNFFKYFEESNKRIRGSKNSISSIQPKERFNFPRGSTFNHNRSIYRTNPVSLSTQKWRSANTKIPNTMGIKRIALNRLQHLQSSSKKTKNQQHKQQVVLDTNGTAKSRLRGTSLNPNSKYIRLRPEITSRKKYYHTPTTNRPPETEVRSMLKTLLNNHNVYSDPFYNYPNVSPHNSLANLFNQNQNSNKRFISKPQIKQRLVDEYGNNPTKDSKVRPIINNNSLKVNQIRNQSEIYFPNKIINSMNNAKYKFQHNLLPNDSPSSTKYFLSASFIDPSDNTRGVDTSNLYPLNKKKNTGNIGQMFLDHSEKNDGSGNIFNHNLYTQSSTQEPIGLINKVQEGTSQKLEIKKTSSKPNAELQSESTTKHTKNPYHTSGKLSYDNYAHTDFLSASEENIVNNGYYDNAFSLFNGNTHKQSNDESSSFETVKPLNFTQSDINSMVQEIFSKGKVPLETNNSFSILRNNETPFPEHAIQLVHNISDILKSNQPEEQALSELYDRFREMFGHAESILSGKTKENTKSNSISTIPLMNKTPNYGSDNRIVIIYRPVLFVSQESNGSWSRILAKGYKPSIVTGDGENNEMLTNEVLHTVGPEMLEKIREHYAKGMANTKKQNVETISVNGKQQLIEMRKNADKYIIIGDLNESGRVANNWNTNENIFNPTTYTVEMKGKPSNEISSSRRDGVYVDNAFMKMNPTSNANENPSSPLLDSTQRDISNAAYYSGLKSPSKPQAHISHKTRGVAHLMPMSQNIILSPKLRAGEESRLKSLSKLQNIDPGRWWFTNPSKTEEGKPKYVLRRIVKRRRGHNFPILRKFSDRRVLNSKEMRLRQINRKI